MKTLTLAGLLLMTAAAAQALPDTSGYFEAGSCPGGVCPANRGSVLGQARERAAAGPVVSASRAVSSCPDGRCPRPTMYNGGSPSYGGVPSPSGNGGGRPAKGPLGLGSSDAAAALAALLLLGARRRE